MALERPEPRLIKTSPQGNESNGVETEHRPGRSSSTAHREHIMTADGLYGDRLAKLFPMIREPNSGLVKSLQKGTFAAVRMAYSGPVGDPTLPSPPDEAFALCLRLQHQRAE